MPAAVTVVSASVRASVPRRSRWVSADWAAEKSAATSAGGRASTRLTPRTWRPREWTEMARARVAHLITDALAIGAKHLVDPPARQRTGQAGLGQPGEQALDFP